MREESQGREGEMRQKCERDHDGSLSLVPLFSLSSLSLLSPSSLARKKMAKTDSVI
jgi:hypothetical protein